MNTNSIQTCILDHNLSLVLSKHSHNCTNTSGGYAPYRGTLTLDGECLRRDGNIVGEFNSNGTIRDANGAILGEFQNDHIGTVRSNNGSILGEIDTNGIVRANGGAILGEVSDRRLGAVEYFFKQI